MKKILAVAAVVAVAVIVALLVIWIRKPHTAKEQFERAEEMAQALASAKELPQEKRQELAQKIITEYEKVYQKFPPPQEGEEDYADDARFKIAEVYRETLQDYQTAIKRYEEVVQKHPESDLAQTALFRIAQIYDENIKEPRIEAIRAYQRFLDTFPESDLADECAFRLAEIYEELGEDGLAIQVYQKLVDEYPESPLASRAQYRIGVIYGERMKEYEEARVAFEKLKEEFPESQEAAYARAMGEAAGERGAEEKRKEYFREYYGIPEAETSWEKPLPPYEIFKELIEQELDILDYKIDLHIKPEESSLSAKAVVRMVNQGQEKDALLFLLHPALELEAVEVKGPSPYGSGSREEKVAFDKDDGLVRLRFPQRIGKGEGLEVVFQYSGQIRDDERLKIGPEGGYGLSGAFWYPQNFTGDLHAARVSLHLPHTPDRPDGLVGVVPGTLDQEGYFSPILPVFGIYFAYGNYTKKSIAWRGKEISIYCTNESATIADQILKTAEDILEFYSQKFGEYPFDNLTLVETELPAPRGAPSGAQGIGGVAPPTLVFLNSILLRMGKVPTNLLAHEISHQWWGNLVPVSLKKGYTPWFSEGFATYSDALYVEKTLGRERMMQHLVKMGHLYFQSTLYLEDEPLGTCYINSPMYRPVVYAKGARVLHSLRGLLGDEAFFRVLKEFASGYALKDATLADFKSIAEEVSQKKLDSFFEDWFEKKGFPHYKISEVKMEAVEGAPQKFHISLIIEQLGEIFTGSLEVAFYGQGAEERKEIFLGERSAPLSFTLSFKPERIVLDPDYWVLREPSGDDIWPRFFRAGGAKK